MYGCAALSSMPSSFTATRADRGCGVTSPLALKDPESLIRVSRLTVTGLARSKLAPSTLSENGASRTFAAGVVLRSSAEMSASRTANSRNSNFHGAAAGAGAGAVAVAPASAAASAAGAVATLVVALAAGCAGAPAAFDAGGCINLSKLTEPSGSSHVRSFSPGSVNDSE